jgi:protein TonB
METNNILSASLLDLVFDNRNKDYGAYDLRATYHTRIKKALFITGSLTLLVLTGTVLGNSFKPSGDKKLLVKTISLEKAPDPKQPEPVQPPPSKIPPKPIERTEAFVTTKIVPDKDVVKPPPDQEDLSHANIDLTTHDGVDPSGEVDLKTPDDGKGIIETKKDNGPQLPFTAVEVDAKFLGDWSKFLLRNLRSNTPVDNGAAAGKYKVVIRFVVDVDGSVSDIVALSNNGYGMEEEAVRVLKKAEKWEPAIQNGTHVKAYRMQAIIFDVNAGE